MNWIDAIVIHQGSANSILIDTQRFPQRQGIHYAVKRILYPNQLIRDIITVLDRGLTVNAIPAGYMPAGAIDLTESYSPAERDQLYDAGINPIIPRGVVGARALGNLYRSLDRAGNLKIETMIDNQGFTVPFLEFMQRGAYNVPAPLSISPALQTAPAVPQTAAIMLPIHRALRVQRPPQIGLLTIEF
jgi:hypothetical protein